MLRRLRENGPIVLVPLAWTFVTVAHLGAVDLRTLLIAHVVIDAVLLVFALASWSDMTEGVLLAWKLVLLVGLGVTLVGTAGLAVSPPVSTALAVTVAGWMLVPAAALAYTGRRVTAAPGVYTVGAGLSVLGALVYFLGPAAVVVTTAHLVGLTLVNVGQTAGIVNAVYQY